ncbi:hypothetical protein ACFQX6_66155 [Streptosporangium lutulentum]
MQIANMVHGTDGKWSAVAAAGATCTGTRTPPTPWSRPASGAS